MAAPGEWTFERSRRKGRSPGVSPGPLVHLVDIDNLLPEMTYFYEVQSADMSGNASEVILRSFRTLAEPDILAPTITLGPVITALSNTTAQIEWATDEQATTVLDHGTRRAYEIAHTEDAERVTTHAVTLTGLVADVVYHYRIESTDESGNTVDTDPGGTRQHNRIITSRHSRPGTPIQPSSSRGRSCTQKPAGPPCCGVPTKLWAMS